MAVDPAFAALRERFDRRHRAATPAVPSDAAVLATGLGELDAILAGGFPRGAISVLDGPPSAGRSAVAARVLAVATRRGPAALIGLDLFPPALAAAGVRLDRLLLVPAAEPLAAARAADVVLRAGAFGAVVVPAFAPGRGTGAAAWTRLATLAHRANAVLLAVGDVIGAELAALATVRVETAIAALRWNGPPGHAGELRGYDVRAIVRKHKRAAAGGDALVRCETFEDRPTAAAVVTLSLSKGDKLRMRTTSSA